MDYEISVYVRPLVLATRADATPQALGWIAAERVNVWHLRAELVGEGDAREEGDVRREVVSLAERIILAIVSHTAPPAGRVVLYGRLKFAGAAKVSFRLAGAQESRTSSCALFCARCESDERGRQHGVSVRDDSSECHSVCGALDAWAGGVCSAPVDGLREQSVAGARGG